ncbi:MAG: DUF4054 domain-containing protein [Desulfovibrionaceae bacterium]
MAAVVLDIPTFRGIYPQFEALSDAQVNNAFNVACLLLDNTDVSIVPYVPGVNTEREVLLYLLTCHLCELALRASGVVGTITAAAQGSVNASFTMPPVPNAQWFSQTQCGLTYWQATLKFRQGRYYGKLCN